MIKYVLLSTVALGALAGTALAADLPSRRAPPVYVPPPPVPVFTWTGLYVGGHVGYQFGRSNGFLFNNATGVGLAANSAGPGGIVGGAHVGYLFSTQTIPYFGGFGGGVFGIEGDVDGSSYKSAYALGGVATTGRQNIQGSVRGRLGVAVDRVLFYATGGAAFGSFNNTYFNGVANTFDATSHTRVGYTVGAGVEYAFTNNISARVEYRYTDYGSYTDNLVNSQAGGASARHRETNNRIMGGISYRFGGFGSPVVARY